MLQWDQKSEMALMHQNRYFFSYFKRIKVIQFVKCLMENPDAPLFYGKIC